MIQIMIEPSLDDARVAAPSGSSIPIRTGAAAPFPMTVLPLESERLMLAQEAVGGERTFALERLSSGLLAFGRECPPQCQLEHGLAVIRTMAGHGVDLAADDFRLSRARHLWGEALRVHRTEVDISKTIRKTAEHAESELAVSRRVAPGDGGGLGGDAHARSDQCGVRCARPCRDREAGHGVGGGTGAAEQKGCAVGASRLGGMDTIPGAFSNPSKPVNRFLSTKCETA